MQTDRIEFNRIERGGKHNSLADLFDSVAKTSIRSLVNVFILNPWHS